MLFFYYHSCIGRFVLVLEILQANFETKYFDSAKVYKTLQDVQLVKKTGDLSCEQYSNEYLVVNLENGSQGEQMANSFTYRSTVMRLYETKLHLITFIIQKEVDGGAKQYVRISEMPLRNPNRDL